MQTLPIICALSGPKRFSVTRATILVITQAAQAN